MSSPVSSRQLLILQEALQGAVFSGVVVDSVLPAFPDHVQPGSGEDADGVGVVVPAGSCAVVQVGGPGVGASRVGGEVGDSVAQLLVAGPAEPDCADLAGLSGRGCRSGKAAQGFGGGEARAAVADLGQQSGGAYASGAGQRGEDVRVGVQGQLFVDLGGQALDLLDQGGQDGQQRPGDVSLSGAVFAGRAARRGGQPGVQDGGIDAAAVAHGAQPCSKAFGREPVGAVLGVEAGQ